MNLKNRKRYNTDLSKANRFWQDFSSMTKRDHVTRTFSLCIYYAQAVCAHGHAHKIIKICEHISRMFEILVHFRGTSEDI